MPLAVDVYGRAHVPALTAAQAAALDRRAREQLGVPERVLMESAGRADRPKPTVWRSIESSSGSWRAEPGDWARTRV